MEARQPATCPLPVGIIRNRFKAILTLGTSRPRGFQGEPGAGTIALGTPYRLASTLITELLMPNHAPAHRHKSAEFLAWHFLGGAGLASVDNLGG